MEKFTQQVTYLHEQLAPEVEIETFAEALDLKAIGLSDRTQLYAPINFSVQVSGGINSPAGAIRLDVPVHANPQWLNVMKRRFAKVTGLVARELDFKTVGNKSISTFEVDQLDRVGKLRLFVKDKQVLLPKMPPIPLEYSVSKLGSIQTWFRTAATEDLPELLADELISKNAVQVDAAVRPDGSIMKRIESHLKQSCSGGVSGGGWNEFARVHHLNSPDEMDPKDAADALKLVSKEVLGTVRQFVEASAPEINRHIASMETRKLTRELKAMGQDAEHYKPILGGGGGGGAPAVASSSARGVEMYRKLFSDALSSPVLERAVVDIIYNKPIAACRWDKEPFDPRNGGSGGGDHEEHHHGGSSHRSHSSSSKFSNDFPAEYAKFTAAEKAAFSDGVVLVSELMLDASVPIDEVKNQLMLATPKARSVAALRYGMPVPPDGFVSWDALADHLVKLRDERVEVFDIKRFPPSEPIPGLSTLRPKMAAPAAANKPTRQRSPERSSGLSEEEQRNEDLLDRLIKKGRGLGLKGVTNLDSPLESIGARPPGFRQYTDADVAAFRGLLKYHNIPGDFSEKVFTDEDALARALLALKCMIPKLREEKAALEKARRNPAASKGTKKAVTGSTPKKLTPNSSSSTEDSAPPRLGAVTYTVIDPILLPTEMQAAAVMWEEEMLAAKENRAHLVKVFVAFRDYIVKSLSFSEDIAKAEVRDKEKFKELVDYGNWAMSKTDRAASLRNLDPLAAIANSPYYKLLPYLGVAVLGIKFKNTTKWELARDEFVARMRDIRKGGKTRRDEMLAHINKYAAALDKDEASVAERGKQEGVVNESKRLKAAMDAAIDAKDVIAFRGAVANMRDFITTRNKDGYKSTDMRELVDFLIGDSGEEIADVMLTPGGFADLVDRSARRLASSARVFNAGGGTDSSFEEEEEEQSSEDARDQRSAAVATEKKESEEPKDVDLVAVVGPKGSDVFKAELDYYTNSLTPQAREHFRGMLADMRRSDVQSQQLLEFLKAAAEGTYKGSELVPRAFEMHVVAIMFGIRRAELQKIWQEAKNNRAYLRAVAPLVQQRIQRGGKPIIPDGYTLIESALVGEHHPWNAFIHHTHEPVTGAYPAYYNVLVRGKQDVSKEAPYTGGDVLETYKAYHLFSGAPIAPVGIRVAPIECGQKSNPTSESEEEAEPTTIKSFAAPPVVYAAAPKAIPPRPRTKPLSLAEKMRSKLIQERSSAPEDDDKVDAMLDDDEFPGLPSCSSFDNF